MRGSAPLGIALAALLLAGITAARVFLVGGGGAASPDRGAPESPGDLETARRLDALERALASPRLDGTPPAAAPTDLEERVARLEQQALRGATRASSSRESPAPPEAAGPIDLRMLPDGDLLARARGKTQNGVIAAEDAAETLRLWQEVLSRRPDDRTAREAWLGVGFSQRVLDQHAESLSAFREAARLARGDEAAEQWSTYQVAWAERLSGDPAAARETMAAVTRMRGGSSEIAGHARLYEAEFSLLLEDLPRARAALEAILRDHGTSTAPMAEWLAEQARQRLRRLDAR